MVVTKHGDGDTEGRPLGQFTQGVEWDVIGTMRTFALMVRITATLFRTVYAVRTIWQLAKIFIVGAKRCFKPAEEVKSSRHNETVTLNTFYQVTKFKRRNFKPLEKKSTTI